MFKWPGVPSAQADLNELGDFVELTAWQRGSMSITATLQALGRLEENDYRNGVPEEEEAEGIVEAAYSELSQRREFCRTGYPFAIDQPGYTLRVSPDSQDSKSILYKYLLLATRLNMNTNRDHSGCNGTLLLEELAEEVARNYLGSRSESLVFGTASNISSFEGRVNFLCQQIGEGGGFENRGLKPPTERDGKLDVVAWKDFADHRPGKIILFGQCKTGTHYKEELAKLQPGAFRKKYMRSIPVVNPVRAFFVSEALPETNWHNMSVDAGLLFDRCRIIDFCDSVSEVALGKIKAWTQAAAQANDLPGL